MLTCAKDEPYVDLSRAKILIVDEADQMVDQGFEPQVAELVTDAGMPRGSERQNLMFSATFPPGVKRLASALIAGDGLRRVLSHTGSHTTASAW